MYSWQYIVVFMNRMHLSPALGSILFSVYGDAQASSPSCDRYVFPSSCGITREGLLGFSCEVSPSRSCLVDHLCICDSILKFWIWWGMCAKRVWRKPGRTAAENTG